MDTTRSISAGVLNRQEFLDRTAEEVGLTLIREFFW